MPTTNHSKILETLRKYFQQFDLSLPYFAPLADGGRAGWNDFGKEGLIVLDIGMFERDRKISNYPLRLVAINIKYICTKSPLLI